MKCYVNLKYYPMVRDTFFWYLKGKRPVSLIGFSLGARVIYYCLQELANDQGINIFLWLNHILIMHWNLIDATIYRR